MHEYGAYTWEQAVAMPLVRVFALQAVAAVRHGMVAAAPSYGERARIDALNAAGAAAKDKLIIRRGGTRGRRIQSGRKSR